jgi:hypothetical protein
MILFETDPLGYGSMISLVATFFVEYDFSGITIVPFARTREVVWGEVLRISPSFARSQPFWMFLQSVAET